MNYDKDRLQQLAGIKEIRALGNSPNEIFADFDKGGKDDIFTKFGKRLVECLMNEGYGTEMTIDDIHNDDDIHYHQKDDFYGSIGETETAFNMLPNEFIIKSNIDGDNLVTFLIKKTGDRSFTVSSQND